MVITENSDNCSVFKQNSLDSKFCTKYYKTNRISCKKSFVLFLLSFMFLSFVHSYAGVSPGMYNIDFEPGMDRVFTFEFLGDADSDFEVYMEGDLERYATLNIDELKGGGFVNVLLELPDEMDTPGVHVLYVGAREIGPSEGVSVVSNVQAQIILNVPYPGKYATMSFSASDASMGEEVKLKVKITNLGDEEVNFVGKINVYNEKNKFLESFEVGEFNYQRYESEEIEYLLDTTPYPPGKYFAEAVFEYETDILTQKEPFRLGELSINIIDATRKVDRDSINKFDVVIESQWNEPIQNVYAEITVFGQGIKFTTPSINLGGFQTSNLTGFFDTTGIIDDNFNVNVRIFYEGKISEKFVKLSFRDKTNYIVIGAVTLGAIFIIIVTVLIILAFRLKKIKDEITHKKRK